MSRHTITPIDPTHTVTIGWDNGLGTYFAQVETPTDEDEPTFWIGTDFGEIRDPRQLVDALRPYAQVTESHIATLRQDRVDGLDSGVTFATKIGLGR